MSSWYAKQGNGGYSGPGIKPVALRCVAQIAKATGLPISDLEGISSWEDAVEFIALGASTVQVGLSVMWNEYNIIEEQKRQLDRYLNNKGFSELKSIIGIALPKILEFPDMPAMSRARPIVNESCNNRSLCVIACADGGFQAISITKGEKITINTLKCNGCGLCAMICPTRSIKMLPIL